MGRLRFVLSRLGQELVTSRPLRVCLSTKAKVRLPATERGLPFALSKHYATEKASEPTSGHSSSLADPWQRVPHCRSVTSAVIGSARLVHYQAQVNDNFAAVCR